MPSHRNPDPSTRHPAYIAWQDRWRLVRAVVEGACCIKSSDTGYYGGRPIREMAIPPLSGHEGKDAAYSSYVEGAHFFPATRRFAEAMSGILFHVPPEIVVPSGMERWIENVTGGDEPQSAEEFTEAVGDDLLRTGRVGILTDYPNVDLMEPLLPRDLTRAEGDRRGLMPTWTLYRAEDIVNWRVIKIGGRKYTQMVVLREERRVGGEDEFSHATRLQWRVLDLVPGVVGGQPALVYRQRVWYKLRPEAREWSVIQTFPMRDGSLMTRIPLQICGARENTWAPDEPPLLDLADVNVAHLRNSALYEHALKWVGNPLPWVTGYDPMIEEGFDDSPPVDAGPSEREVAEAASAERAISTTDKYWRWGATELKLIKSHQAKVGITSLKSEDISGLREAMDAKRDEMIAIGGRILAPDKLAAEAAATEEIRRSGEISILSKMAQTISSAMTRSLEEARDWMPEAVSGEVGIKLRSEFSLRNMTPEEATAVSEAVMGGIMAKSDARRLFRLGRWIDPDRTDEEIDADIAQDLAGEMLPAGLGLPAGGPPTPPAAGNGGAARGGAAP